MSNTTGVAHLRFVPSLLCEQIGAYLLAWEEAGLDPGEYSIEALSRYYQKLWEEEGGERKGGDVLRRWLVSLYLLAAMLYEQSECEIVEPLQHFELMGDLGLPYSCQTLAELASTFLSVQLSLPLTLLLFRAKGKDIISLLLE